MRYYQRSYGWPSIALLLGRRSEKEAVDDCHVGGFWEVFLLSQARKSVLLNLTTLESCQDGSYFLAGLKRLLSSISIHHVFLFLAGSVYYASYFWSRLLGWQGRLELELEKGAKTGGTRSDWNILLTE